MIPAITFVILLSKLAHKEWRFIVYVIPVFNIAAARGATWMYVPLHVRPANNEFIDQLCRTSRKKAGIFGKVCFLIVVGLICGDLLVTSIFIRSSMANYPGGEALHRLNTRYAIDPHGTLTSPLHI